MSRRVDGSQRKNQAWLSWQKRSHFRLKLFCDLSLAAVLAGTDQVPAMTVLKWKMAQ